MTLERHLLVIRLSAMGDVAMTVPVLLALTQKYPNLKITILTRGFFKPMFTQLPNVFVFEADVKGKHKGVLGLLKLYKELKTLKIDAVADLHNVLRSNILKTYFTVGGIPVVQIDKGRAEKSALTALKSKKFVQLKTTHQRYADVFKKLGFTFDFDNIKLLKKEAIAESTQKRIGADTKRWIGIAPFAAYSGKMYPLELMEKVVSELSKTNRYKIIFFGGGTKEKEQLAHWEYNYSNTLNIAGQIAFSEELAVISQLDVMLAMDSGNAHISAMYGIPTITLWGVTHPYAGFYPFGQNETNALLADREMYPLIPTSVYGNKFPEGYDQVMETISPEMVLKKIAQTIS
tara:strand:+ start:255939 stop:256976 length:1038 start_codon:yes stop_codon:yes gene_type:complete